ncbi:MAG: T9SS type A sorting domain-containing protein [candidate division Zixibacteria bacterium]|nr:T9SS type A sorting domain-containing protein [candidate division Zixibacteria bacterium]
MVLGLNSWESEETVREFVEQFGVTFPVLLDGESYNEYRQPGISPYPLDYIIDRDGLVAYFKTEYDPTEMHAVIDSILYELDSDEPEESVPHEFELLNNYPNPFNDDTNFRFIVNSRVYAELTVYDILGREVERIFASTVNPGIRSVKWKANSNDRQLGSGIYFYKLEAGENSAVKKMLYLK